MSNNGRQAGDSISTPPEDYRTSNKKIGRVIEGCQAEERTHARDNNDENDKDLIKDLYSRQK